VRISSVALCKCGSPAGRRVGVVSRGHHAPCPPPKRLPQRATDGIRRQVGRCRNKKVMKKSDGYLVTCELASKLLPRSPRAVAITSRGINLRGRRRTYSPTIPVFSFCSGHVSDVSVCEATGAETWIGDAASRSGRSGGSAQSEMSESCLPPRGKSARFTEAQTRRDEHRSRRDTAQSSTASWSFAQSRSARAVFLTLCWDDGARGPGRGGSMGAIPAPRGGVPAEGQTRICFLSKCGADGEWLAIWVCLSRHTATAPLLRLGFAGRAEPRDLWRRPLGDGRGQALGWGGGFGVEPPALSDISREVPVLARAMPFGLGTVTAGRGFRLQSPCQVETPTCEQRVLYSIPPTVLRRRQEPCAGLNITARCLWVGKQGKISGAQERAP
jgi:hypothetical protein